MRKPTIIAALAVVLAVVVGGGAWAASTHSSTLTPGANESVSSVWVELQNQTETTIEVYVGGSYQEQLKDTDTANELNNATYSGNWTIDGSGESAVARVTPPVPPSSEVFVDDDWPTKTTKHVWTGDSAGRVTSASDATSRSISSTSNATVAVAARIDGGSGYDMLAANGNPVIQIRYNRGSGAIEAGVNPGSNMQIVSWTPPSDYDLSAYHHYAATYNTNTGELILYVDGEKKASKTVTTGMTFDGTLYFGNNGYGSTYRPLEDGYLDAGRWYGQTLNSSEISLLAQTSGATYTASAKDAGNATEMSASIPSVTGAEVTLEAQGYTDSGTWVTVDSQTVSSAATVSTDVSGLDYSRWRWKVTVSPAGSSPSAEIGYTGVYNVSYVPPTLVANKTVTPQESPSVASVDIPSAYADATEYTVEVTGQASSSVGYSTTSTGGAVAAESGATQPDGVSLTLVGTVLGLVVAGVVLHGRRP
ncbi:LamG domain-containing protein [Halorussus limi]|uniref:LamG domain-containing protein n=1 Tax=Halorussus limi TaxID=2938695 RepID=A0A8U0HQL2_9EURY|nr:LamG domain-containing protein [Halorussus limi]UPV73177.1 LamG domain-containing protein [Halorussus limi]